MDVEVRAALRRQFSRSGAIREQRARDLAERCARRAENARRLAATSQNAMHHLAVAELCDRARQLHEAAAALQSRHAVDEAALAGQDDRAAARVARGRG